MLNLDGFKNLVCIQLVLCLSFSCGHESDHNTIKGDWYSYDKEEDYEEILITDSTLCVSNADIVSIICYDYTRSNNSLYFFTYGNMEDTLMRMTINKTTPNKICYELEHLDYYRGEAIDNCIHRISDEEYTMSDISNWEQKFDTITGDWEESKEFSNYYEGLLKRFSNIIQ